MGWKFPAIGHGDRARATETKGRKTERRSHGDRGAEDREMERWRDGEMERWRDGEMERWRSRARTWQATERDACSNRNVKGGEEVRLGTRSVKPGYEIRNVINVKN